MVLILLVPSRHEAPLTYHMVRQTVAISSSGIVACDELAALSATETEALSSELICGLATNLCTVPLLLRVDGFQ